MSRGQSQCHVSVDAEHAVGPYMSGICFNVIFGASSHSSNQGLESAFGDREVIRLAAYWERKLHNNHRSFRTFGSASSAAGALFVTLNRRSNEHCGSKKSFASSVRSDCFSSFSVVAVSQADHTSSIECIEIPSTLATTFASAFASAASCRYSPAFSLMLINLGISTGQFTSFKTFAMLPASWCPI